MGVSIQTLSLVLVCLLAVLAVLVVGQLVVKRTLQTMAISPQSGGARWELSWFASPAALFGGFLGGIAAAVPFALVGGSAPDAVMDAAVFICGLVPCAILGSSTGVGGRSSVQRRCCCCGRSGSQLGVPPKTCSPTPTSTRRCQ